MALLRRDTMGAPYSLCPTTTAGFQTPFALDGPTDTAEWILQAEDAITITHLGFRYAARTGTPPTYRVSIQGVDSTGIPNGTIKGGGSPASAIFTPPASTAWNATFQWIALSNSYACGRGELMAFVIDYSSGTVDASNMSTLNTCMSAHGGGRLAFPYAIENPAGVRARQGNYPLVGYKSSTRSYGTCWQSQSATSYSSTSSPNEYGTAFSLPLGATSTYTVVGVRALILTPAAAKTVLVTLYDGTTPQQTMTLDSDVVRVAATATQIIELYFDETSLTTLTAGTTYYLGFAPQETAANLALTTWTAASAQDAQAVGGDGNFYQVTRTGGAWTTDTSTRVALELMIETMTQPNIIINLP